MAETFWTETVDVYLYHFDEPFSHARHYIGSAKNVMERLAEHITGQGSKLMAAVVEAGIGFQIARTWKNVPRFHEAVLHRRNASPSICPICSGNGALNRGIYVPGKSIKPAARRRGK